MIMKQVGALIIFLSVLINSYSQNQVVNGNLQINSQTGNGIRIGKVGDVGKTDVPLWSLAAEINIDFSGYRDVALDQIGARIGAVRYNKYQSNKAYVQQTALVFSTNILGMNTGITDLEERMRIHTNGFIGIGTTSPNHLLDVNGTIRAKEVKIESTGWADFVFKPEYRLLPLSDVKFHIKEKGHLPNIPSEMEVKEKGVDVGEMQIQLLQKIEELTLYLIDQNQEIQILKQEIEKLKSK